MTDELTIIKTVTVDFTSKEFFEVKVYCADEQDANGRTYTMEFSQVISAPVIFTAIMDNTLNFMLWPRT